MRHIIYDDDLHRIDLGEGEWIDILALCTNAIRRKADAATVKAVSRLSALKVAGTVDVEYDAGAYNNVLLEHMIKAWSFKDKSGQAIPVTAENIGKLSTATADLVLAEIEKLNPGRTPEEKKG